MLASLQESLGVAADQVYPITGMLDLADVGQLYALDRSDLKYEPWVPFTQRRLFSPADGDLFEEIGQRDLVVQHPYDSFATSVESFVRAAAKDPRVVQMRILLDAQNATVQTDADGGLEATGKDTGNTALRTAAGQWWDSSGSTFQSPASS